MCASRCCPEPVTSSTTIAISGRATQSCSTSSSPSTVDPGSSASVETLEQADGHGVAGVLVDRPPQVGLHRQLVGAVAERHEAALERVAVDRASHLHQPSG